MVKETFLVIGSNSFSGSNFSNYVLKMGGNVIAISRSKELDEPFLPYKWVNGTKNLNFFQIDLNHDLNQLLKIIDENQPEYVVNFAAQGMVAESWLNPTHWYKTNVVSQVALHNELRKRTSIKKYVHVTTPEVYGDTKDTWIKENFNFAPSTPYAVSRASCDLHLISFLKAYDFPVVFTRAANVYGPGQQLYRIIPRTILSALCKVPMQLHGGGISERCFIHINDVVKATYDISLKAKPGNTFHISSREKISIRDLVIKICERLDVNFEEIVEISNERLGKDQSYLLDSDKLRKNFQWRDEISLNSGLDETIDWVKTYLPVFKNISWDYKHKL